MQIESILIFVVFVVISSMANKRKEAQQKQRQQAKQEKPVNAEMKPPNTTKPAKQMQTNNKKRSLQDLFREMQQEIEGEFKQATAAGAGKKNLTSATTPEKEIAPVTFTYDNTGPAIKPTSKSQKKQKSTVYDDEISDGDREIGFRMTEEAILNGIIFSEVMGKPKAMR